MAALLIHAVDLHQFTHFEFDKVNHVAATASWLQGRGLTIADTGPGGLPATVYRPLLGFPPGYALALAPLLHVFDDIWWSTFVLDVVGQALFLIAWAVMLYLVTRSALTASGMLVLWALVFSPIAANTYSDLLALALYSAGLAVGLVSICSCGPRRAVAVISSALFVSGACVTRYAYWPLVVAVPAATLVTKRDRSAWASAAAHLGLAAAAIAGTLLFMQRTTGEALFLSRWYPDRVRGFFWWQWLTLDPFAADALGAARVYMLVAKDWALLKMLAPLVLWSGFAICAGIAVAYLAGRVRAWFDGRVDARETYFSAAGIVTCATTVAMNLWLALRLPAVSDGWTVAAEPRYFIVTLPFIGVWIWLAARDRSPRRRLLRAIAVVTVVLTIAVSVPVRIIRVYLYVTKNVATSWLAPSRRAEADTLLAAVESISTGAAPPLVVDDSPKWRRYVASMGGALVVKHAAIARCAGRDGTSIRYLVALPPAVASDARARGTYIARIEDVDLLLMEGSPCAPQERVRKGGIEPP